MLTRPECAPCGCRSVPSRTRREPRDAVLSMLRCGPAGTSVCRRSSHATHPWGLALGCPCLVTVLKWTSDTRMSRRDATRAQPDTDSGTTPRSTARHRCWLRQLPCRTAPRRCSSSASTRSERLPVPRLSSAIAPSARRLTAEEAPLSRGSRNPTAQVLRSERPLPRFPPEPSPSSPAGDRASDHPR